MNQLFAYLIHVSTGITIVFFVYYFLFRSERHFALNRIWLLSGLILSGIAPFFSFSSFDIINQPDFVQVLDSITVGNTVAPDKKQLISLNTILLYVYFAGVISTFFWFLFRLIKTIVFIRKNQNLHYNDYILVYTKSEVTPFSFFRWIVIYDGLEQNEFTTVLRHEMAHIRQRHSIDIIIMEMFSIILWFNPLLILYRRSIKETHEFLADRDVISEDIETSYYQKTILAISFGVSVADLTNNFNTSQIKRRIIMMKTMKPRMFAKIKFWLFAPLASALLLFLACNNSDSEESIPISEDLSETTSQINDEVFEVVEVMPVFGNSENALNEYIIANVKYPAEAKKNGIQGKVHVSFIVNQSGKVTDVQVVEPVNELLDAEAIRVISQMPDWKPGMQKGKAVSVKMVLPIQFKLS